jgi:hypothetical protein
MRINSLDVILSAALRNLAVLQGFYRVHYYGQGPFNGTAARPPIKVMLQNERS